MILSSNISLSQTGSRQTSLLDASQLRINRQPINSASNGQTGSQLSLVRQAAYQYNSEEKLAYHSSSQVKAGCGTAYFTSAELAHKSSQLLLQGQQALSVSRAVFGAGSGIEPTGSLSVSASRYSFYSERESRSFTSSGSIALENGETISFTLSLRQAQSHSYEYSESLRIEERPMTDPLVINFGATTAQLTDTLFEFDLAGNGETSQYAMLGSGSGYLVLDRNGNGKVDDGSELFGPQTGSGFAELAQYDDDGNRWIDSNDDIFSSLSVWVQTSDGGQALRSLEEVGVKALYVDSADDQFTLTNSQGVPLGQIKSSGIYLTTEGEVRTLEELDLAAQNTQNIPQAITALSADATTNASTRQDDRVNVMREALGKLNEIRAQQQAFIDRSKEQAEQENPLEAYFELIEKMRLELLSKQNEKKQAASSYLENARAGR